MKIKNYTPHEIVVFTDNGEIRFKSEGICRIASSQQIIGDVDGIPLFNNIVHESGTILPPEVEGVLYIVSGYVKAAYPDRKDFIVPAKLIRDKSGNVIGCGGFSV